MSLNPRAIATLGVGFGAVSIAYLGLWPPGTPPVEPPLPVPVMASADLPERPFIIRDDRDLLDIMPIVIEVLNSER